MINMPEMGDTDVILSQDGSPFPRIGHLSPQSGMKAIPDVMASTTLDLRRHCHHRSRHHSILNLDQMTTSGSLHSSELRDCAASIAI